MITIDDDASIADTLAALSYAHLKKVPVVGADGHRVSIVGRFAINRLAIVGHLDKRAASLEPVGAHA